MRYVIAPFRVLGVFLTMFAFIGYMSLVWLVVRNRWRRVYWSNRILSRFCQWGLFVVNLKVNVVGAENLKTDGSGLYVGNHLTYMDVLALASRVHACFVTSTEIKRAPLLGQVCQMAGCLFVERRNKLNIHNEVSDIREGLKQGLNVAIFPEATSTNGEQILRFRRPLFVAAIDSERPVRPFCMNYRLIGGQPITTANRDKVMWYGDMGFASSIWGLSSSGGVQLDLHFLPEIPTNKEMDPTQLADVAQRSVESVFTPVRPPAG